MFPFSGRAEWNFRCFWKGDIKMYRTLAIKQLKQVDKTDHLVHPVPPLPLQILNLKGVAIHNFMIFFSQQMYPPTLNLCQQSLFPSASVYELFLSFSNLVQVLVLWIPYFGFLLSEPTSFTNASLQLLRSLKGYLYHTYLKQAEEKQSNNNLFGFKFSSRPYYLFSFPLLQKELKAAYTHWVHSFNKLHLDLGHSSLLKWFQGFPVTFLLLKLNTCFTNCLMSSLQHLTISLNVPLKPLLHLRVTSLSSLSGCCVSFLYRLNSLNSCLVFHYNPSLDTLLNFLYFPWVNSCVLLIPTPLCPHTSIMSWIPDAFLQPPSTCTINTSNSTFYFGSHCHLATTSTTLMNMLGQRCLMLS